MNGWSWSWCHPGILHTGIKHKVTRLSNEWLVLDKMPYLAIFMGKSKSQLRLCFGPFFQLGTLAALNFCVERLIQVLQ